MIVHLCNRFTSRIWKEIIGMGMQSETVLMLRETGHIDLSSSLLHISTWLDSNTMLAKLRDMKPQLIHVHVSVGRTAIHSHIDDIAEIAPIVLDIHDCYDYNAALVPHAGAVVAPSESIATQIDGAVCIYSKVPQAYFPEPKILPTIPMFALTSNVVMPGADPDWRDYGYVHERLPLQVFASGAVRPEHAYYNAFPELPYLKMLERLTSYYVGYAGASNDRHRIDDCVTNKFWEYLAAGIPVMTFRSAEMTQIAKDNHWGMEWDGKKMRSCPDWPLIREEVRLSKDKLTFESSETIKLIRIYVKIMDQGKRGGE